MTFSKSKFLTGISILNTRYKHLKSQNNNLFYFFYDQVDYALVHYFVDSETTKCNINKFFTNSLIRPITKNLLYCNTDKWMKKLFAIPSRIPYDK